MWTADASAAVTQAGNQIYYHRSPNLWEWFIDDNRGLQQGWTILERPEGAGARAPLRLEFSVRGGLHPGVDHAGTTVRYVSADLVNRLTYSGLQAWDARGRAVPARFESVEGRSDLLRIAIDDSNAEYPLTVDPVAQQAYLKASNPGSSDGFGSGAAISGDTLVVGAVGEDSNATSVNGNQTNNSASGAGAAYVFIRNGTTWTQQAYLKPPNSGAGDGFGTAVAISGNTIVVGATGEDSNATGVNGNQTNNTAADAGAAYVFVRNGTVWTHQAYLKSSNTESGDAFGKSVAIEGDTVVVGATGEDSNAMGVGGNQTNNGAAGAGAAYIFTRNGTTWTQEAYLKAGNTDAGDGFGGSVSISGDSVLVGASGEDGSATGVNGNATSNAAPEAGAAYLFVRNGTAWTQQAYLKASNAEGSDFFGGSVAIYGDRAVVGANCEDSGATGVNGNQASAGQIDSGAAYIFVRTGSDWAQEAYLKASNTQGLDLFGSSVAISAETVVATATFEDSAANVVNGNQSNDGASNAGAAYVFTRNGTSWAQSAYLKASNAEAVDLFGQRAAISGNTVVVTADAEDGGSAGVNGNDLSNSAADAGAAYAFDLDAPPTPEIGLEEVPATSNITLTILDGGNLTFNATQIETAESRTVRISNTGTADLTGLAITFGGAHPSQFFVSQNATAPVPPGGNTTFVVAFRPTSGGPKTATLQIANNDPNEAPFDINLSGTGLAPLIEIHQPPGNPISNGGNRLFVAPTGSNNSLTFLIRNTGTGNLTGLVASVNGTHAANFTITEHPVTSLTPYQNATCSIQFTATAGGNQTAILQMASNDPANGLFSINLIGRGLTSTLDFDGDGLNDLAEYKMSSLGFDWSVSEPAEVAAYYSTANTAGLYTPEQVHALNAGAPLLTRNPITGNFTITLALRKSSDLVNFAPFPFVAPQMNLNESGELLFEFGAPEGAAFFRIEAR